MTGIRTAPPPRDIHTWFSLSYAEYLVLGREKLAGTATGREIVAMLEQLAQAYAHLDVPQYRVVLGHWTYLGEMDDGQLAAAGFQLNTPSGDADPSAEDLEEMAGKEVSTPTASTSTPARTTASCQRRTGHDLKRENCWFRVRAPSADRRCPFYGRPAVLAHLSDRPDDARR